MSYKQVIVVRKDLNMRKGKIAAQVAHASMGAVLSCASVDYAEEGLGGGGYPVAYTIPLKVPELREWLLGSFTKICVSVDSEQELLDAYAKAQELGLIRCLITDNGLTEFGGVKTNTCVAIGPAAIEDINIITGHMKLL